MRGFNTALAAARNASTVKPLGGAHWLNRGDAGAVSFYRDTQAFHPLADATVPLQTRRTRPLWFYGRRFDLDLIEGRWDETGGKNMLAQSGFAQGWWTTNATLENDTPDVPRLWQDFPVAKVTSTGGTSQARINQGAEATAVDTVRCIWAVLRPGNTDRFAFAYWNGTQDPRAVFSTTTESFTNVDTPWVLDTGHYRINANWWLVWIVVDALASHTGRTVKILATGDDSIDSPVAGDYFYVTHAQAEDGVYVPSSPIVCSGSSIARGKEELFSDWSQLVTNPADTTGTLLWVGSPLFWSGDREPTPSTDGQYTLFRDAWDFNICAKRNPTFSNTLDALMRDGLGNIASCSIAGIAQADLPTAGKLCALALSWNPTTGEMRSVYFGSNAGEYTASTTGIAMPFQPFGTLGIGQFHNGTRPFNGYCGLFYIPNWPSFDDLRGIVSNLRFTRG